MTKAPSPNALGRSVRGFFSEYVPELRGLSRHTLLSYRGPASYKWGKSLSPALPVVFEPTGFHHAP